MKPVRFLTSAKHEVLDAARYYNIQARGVGDDFLDEIDSAAKEIGENPERWPVVRVNVRRYLIQRFPYALLYRVYPKEIVLVAAMHLRRRPDYWIHRL